jgi:release factor glutamine methyltransferase
MTTAAGNDRSFARGQDLMQRTVRDVTQPTTFALLGREWTLLPQVFSPMHTPITELFTSWLPYPVGGSFLEIGSGAGVTAVTAALAGCRRVTAVDISASAVENTRLNVARHRVTRTVRVVKGDLFEALQPDERFDLVFWNSSFVEPPAGHVNEGEFDRAFFDPDYRTHERFLREAPRYLRPSGRLVLGFSDLGNRHRLEELAAASGFELSIIRAEKRQTEIQIEFQLVELLAVAT